MLHLAWVRDLEGRRDEAIKLYKQIVDNYENEAPSGAARLGLITPYRGRVGRAAQERRSDFRWALFGVSPGDDKAFGLHRRKL